MTEVVKRNGEVVPFNPLKIEDAIFKASKSLGRNSRKSAEETTRRVLRILENQSTESVPVERIQDTVEDVLVKSGDTELAKVYILYREKRRIAREGNSLVQQTSRLFHDYMDERDWRVKENSNQNYSVNGLNNYVRENFTKLFWLNEVYPENIKKAHEEGDFHLHDLGFFGPYCAGWDIKSLLMYGFGGVPQKIDSKPAKHLRSLLNQIVNSTFTTQGESAGAQAWSSIDTYCAPFIAKDNLTYTEVKQAVQEFIFSLNIPTRVGQQSPFSNLTFDIKCPDTLKDEAVIIGGEIQKEHYGDFQKEMDMFNLAFCEVMLEGDAKGRVFTFPIPTINITKDTVWDSEVMTKFMETSCRYGIPYFSNYVNSDLSPEDALSMCPLTGDTTVLVKHKSSGNLWWSEISSVFERCEAGEEFSVPTQQGWCDARPVKTAPTEIFEIHFKTGETRVKMGKNHLQPIRNGQILKAEDLEVGMELPFVFFNVETLEEDKFNFETEYVEISSIVRKNNSDPLYCFEVDNRDHLFILPNGLITHNCRLRLDKTELRKRGGGLFGSNPMTGSIGVVTINLPRLAYLSENKKDFLARLEYLAELAKVSLELKRKVIEEQTEKGMYPFSANFLKDVKKRTGEYWFNHFNTIGIVGMNEACLNFLGDDLTTEWGQEFAAEVLEFLREKMKEFQDETGHVFNLEATPAEGTSYRLARIDKNEFPEIITAGTEEIPYYTNSSQLPVNFTDDIFETLDLQDDLQCMYTGGTVLHLYLGERILDVEVAKDLIRTVFENYKLPYLSLTPTFSVCPNHGYIVGEHFECPECGEETEVWSRVVGYLRPVQNFHKGKKQEYEERVKFSLKEETM